MHPAILIVLFLMYALGVAAASPAAVLCGLLMLLAARLLLGGHVPAGTLRGSLRRVRWLLLALTVTHLWFTPGVRLWPELGTLSPTAAGLSLAVWRALALLEMVAGAALLIARCGRDGLSGGLYWLATPFGSVRERLAVRVGLTLECLPQVRALLGAGHDESAAAPSSGVAGRVRRIARAAVGALAQADAVPFALADAPSLRIVVPPPPPWWQWLWPLALGLLFIALARLES